MMSSLIPYKIIDMSPNHDLTMTNRLTGCGNEKCVLSQMPSTKGNEIQQGIAGCVKNCSKGGTRFVWNYLYSEGHTHLIC